MQSLPEQFRGLLLDSLFYSDVEEVNQDKRRCFTTIRQSGVNAELFRDYLLIKDLKASRLREV